ncbi:MAG: hypothetical protein M1586_00470 [Patescibacteria group bacterium]|nr:hypothetical protein [Patescibacteria group bacterium]MCL5261761.1 hypothetical protein [Patescibacteria group bacterium]
MKKQYYFTFLLIIVIVACHNQAQAATIKLDPENKTLIEGQSFQVDINIFPGESRVYTVKAVIDYPAEYLRLTSFNFVDQWLPLAQSDYSVIDNVNGRLIKTAGYPGGINSITKLGTAIFVPQKIGGAKVSTAADSAILDNNNRNIFDNIAAQASFKLVAALQPDLQIPVKTSELPFEEETLLPSPEIIKPIKPNVLLLAMAFVLLPFNPIFFLAIAFAALAGAFTFHKTRRDIAVHFNVKDKIRLLRK